jgi:hypothetical protein
MGKRTSWLSKEVVLETGSYFSIPGDKDANAMHAAQSSIPGGIGSNVSGAVDVE